MASYAYTKKQTRRAFGGALAGAGTGAVVGSVAAGKTVKSTKGVKATKTMYRGAREMGGGRLKSVGTATRLAPGLAHAATKAPHTVGSALASTAGMYGGIVAGSLAGEAAARKTMHPKPRVVRRRVQKNDTLSAFGIDHG